MTLLAHHFEAGFTPIYVGQFALGIWVGWRLVSTLLRKWPGGGTDLLARS
ncbi:MAG TPA: hypothetical protein VND64_31710 [Pirellulales bacterium]|nr:hypothetical protein [Pirellulales bacterium]